MNKIIKSLVLVAALGGVTLPVTAQRRGELTEAVMRAYQQTLDQDPTDYITYYRRAMQYYLMGRYDEAMRDIDSALKFTPAKDADMLQQEYALQSELLRKRGDLQGALQAADRCLTINPKSYADTYRKGNILLEMKNGDEAYRTFKSLLNLRSRSQEAMIGMAKASILLGNTKEAESLIEEAKENDSTNPLTYLHVGEVQELLGQNNKAVVNYISALSLADDITRSVEALENVALKDYKGYCEGYDFAITQSGDSRPTLEYIRAVVDFNTGHYRDAYTLMSALKNKGDNVSAPFLTRLARTCLMLDKIDEARTHAEAAITMQPIAEAYLVKSEIDLSSGQPANALINATKANNPEEPDADAMLNMAKAHIALGDGKSANNVLNELILVDGENIPALLLRSYVKKNLLKDTKGAKSDLERAARIDARYMPEMAYKALAQTLSGKIIDGESTINQALAIDNSGDALAAIAIYYAQTGNADKAEEYKNKALAAGCENLYILNTDKTPYLSIAGK